MVHIQKNSEDISSVIGVRTEDLSSGMPWDDDPNNIVEVRFFKESGVFLADKEVTKLELWLTYLLQFLNTFDKEKRYEETAKEVNTFLKDIRYT